MNTTNEADKKNAVLPSRVFFLKNGVRPNFRPIKADEISDIINIESATTANNFGKIKIVIVAEIASHEAPFNLKTLFFISCRRKIEPKILKKITLNHADFLLNTSMDTVIIVITNIIQKVVGLSKCI